MNSRSTQRLVFAATCLALALVLPLITGNLPALGNKMLPMHLPVLLCGFLCGPVYGTLIGFVAPLLRSALFGMPPLYPIAIAMAFELATYGWVTGLLYHKLGKSLTNLYLTLVTAMVFGRLVWGGVSLVLFGLVGNPFTLQIFLAGAFINALPGILLQLMLLPVLVRVLERAGLMSREEKPLYYQHRRS